ncbi:hypothetical protein ABFG93_20300 [Pseudalkalibacillus hwajinpoensis]|uniref:hypothetical protein n=1 Tax=Guptibacillus hwajinpoensis TaxID=208199 RepID=UPI00325ACF9F
MKNEHSLPSRKEYHQNKTTKKRKQTQKKGQENEMPSFTLIRLLALLFIGMVSLFLLYSYFS